MDNKKYLDKILEHLKKGVRVEGDAFYVPYNNIQYHFYYRRSENEYIITPRTLYRGYPTYCRNHFGLTDKEIDKIWGEFNYYIYTEIKDRVTNRG